MGSKGRWGLAVAAAAVVLFGIAGTVSAEFKLPDTGQTKCYQTVEPWAEIPCAGTGQDGAYTINSPCYTDNDNGTVTDNNTELVWQQTPAVDQYYNWYQASGTYDAEHNPDSVDVCGDLRLGGASGWRLPAPEELISIADYGRYDPSFNTTYFFPDFTDNIPFEVFWSLTTSAFNTDGAWVVDFYYGNSYWLDKHEPYYVRCVRGGQAGSFDHFIDQGNGTVADMKTGLVWQQEEPGAKNLKDAPAYCEGLDLGGYSDWRLPNVKELATLADYSVFDPAIDTVYFPNASTYNGYCSSTRHALQLPWIVHFLVGWVGPNRANHPCDVRCVRGGQSISNDTATTAPDTPVTIPVLANDTAPEGGTLAIGSVGTPAHGTATAYGDAILYTPAAGYTGTDIFTYCLTDGTCTNSCAYVTVTIGGPVIAASPNPLRFPNTVTGEASAPRTVTVSNAGNADLVLGAISGLSGDNLDFEIWSDGCSAQTLSPGGACAIEVKFKPIFTGAKIAWFRVPSNDPETGSLEVELLGNQPEISAACNPLVFGATLPGEVSGALTLTVSNSGGADLEVRKITELEGDSGDFQIVDDDCSEHILAPGSACAIAVKFAPSSPGAKSARFNIPSSDPGTPTLAVALEGAGSASEGAITIKYWGTDKFHLSYTAAVPGAQVTAVKLVQQRAAGGPETVLFSQPGPGPVTFAGNAETLEGLEPNTGYTFKIVVESHDCGGRPVTSTIARTEGTLDGVVHGELLFDELNLSAGGFPEWYIGALTVPKGRTLTISDPSLLPSGLDGITVYGTLSLPEGTDGYNLTLELYSPITLTGLKNFTLDFHTGSGASTVEGGENLTVSGEEGTLTIRDVGNLRLRVTEQTSHVVINSSLVVFIDLRGLGSQTDLAFNLSEIALQGYDVSDHRTRSQDAKVVFTACLLSSGTFVIGPDDLPEMMRMESCTFRIPLVIRNGKEQTTRPRIENCLFAFETTLKNRDAGVFEGNLFRREVVFADDENLRGDGPRWTEAGPEPRFDNNSFLGNYALRYEPDGTPPGPLPIGVNYYGDRDGPRLLPTAQESRFLTAHGAMVDYAFTLQPALADGPQWLDKSVAPDFWIFDWIAGQNTISHENHGVGAPMVKGKETLLSIDLGTSSDNLKEVTVVAKFGEMELAPNVSPAALFRDLSYYLRNKEGHTLPGSGAAHRCGRSTFNFFLPATTQSEVPLEVIVDGKIRLAATLRFEDPPPRKLGICIQGMVVLDGEEIPQYSLPERLADEMRRQLPGILRLRGEDLDIWVEPGYVITDTGYVALQSDTADAAILQLLDDILRTGDEAPIDLVVLAMPPGQGYMGNEGASLTLRRRVIAVEGNNVPAFVHELGHSAGLHTTIEQYSWLNYGEPGRSFQGGTAFSPEPSVTPGLTQVSRFSHLFAGNQEYEWVDIMGNLQVDPGATPTLNAWPDPISFPVIDQWLQDTLAAPALASSPLAFLSTTAAPTSLAFLSSVTATRRIFLHAVLRPDPESGIYKPLVGGMRAFDLTAITERGVPPAVAGGDPYRLEAFDADGALVHSEDFQIPGPGEGAESVIIYYPWAATFEVPEAAASLKVTRLADGLVYFTAAASDTITNAFLEPAPGTVLGEKVTVRWEAGSEGALPHPVTGQPFQHLLFLSTDGGATWRPVGLPREEPEVELSTESMPAGNRISLRILTSDGLRTAEARVDGLIVENRPPAVAIQAPIDGSKAVPGTAWTLQATATDPDNDLAGGGTWQSSLDGALGEGLSLQGIVLSPGEHLLSYTAADTAGHTSVAEVHVTVVELPVIDLALAAASLKIYSEARPGQLPVGKEQLAVLGVTNTGTDTTLHLSLYLTPPGGPETLLAEADLGLLPFEHGQVSGRFTTNVEGEYRLRGVIGTTEPPDENEGNNQLTWTFVTVPPAPKIAISPVWRDFEPVEVSQEAVQTFTIANGGTRDLHLGALAFTGTGASDFALRNDTASNRTVAPGATVTVDVVCRPSFTGHTKAALAVLSDDPDFPTLAIDLTGIGTGEAIITAFAGTGGRIDPAGAVSVYLGWDKTFTISPDPGWHVAGILVDGASMGASGTYTFTKVTANHTIAASFAVDPVVLLSPNGGEIFPTGSLQTIRWNAPVSAATYTLEYSADGGGTWEPIADGVAGSSHDWTVPAQPENRPDCLVRITAWNAVGAEHSRSTSSAPFRIEVVKVTAPAAGAILTAGRKVRVSWQVNQTTAPVSSILLQYSRNGGTTWQEIATLKGSARSFIWTVEAVGLKPDPNCFVRVSLDNHWGRSVGSAESGPFTIQPKRGRPLSNW